MYSRTRSSAWTSACHHAKAARMSTPATIPRERMEASSAGCERTPTNRSGTLLMEENDEGSETDQDVLDLLEEIRAVNSVYGKETNGTRSGARWTPSATPLGGRPHAAGRGWLSPPPLRSRSRLP